MSVDQWTIQYEVEEEVVDNDQLWECDRYKVANERRNSNSTAVPNYRILEKMMENMMTQFLMRSEKTT